VEFQMVVTDTLTGEVKGYFNPPRQFASLGDTLAFPRSAGDDSPLTADIAALNRERNRSPARAALEAGTSARRAPISPASRVESAMLIGAPAIEQRESTASCEADAITLCLRGGRFRVRAAWKDFEGRTGTGHAEPLNQTTGYFWFFNDTNVELAIKVLDGRTLNGHHWVFYGALSNVEYVITVQDTETGQERLLQPAPRVREPRRHHRLPRWLAGRRMDAAPVALEARCHESRQGSTRSTEQAAKSATFRVAITAPLERAMAAICASNCEIGRPILRRSTAMRA
jgi:hypothetical protein